VVGVVGTASAGNQPSFLVEDTANGWVYISDQGTNQVSILNGTSLIASVGVGYSPAGLAYDTTSGAVYVADEVGNSVTVIQGTHAVTTIPVGMSPVCPVYDSQDGYVYVLNFQSRTVSVLNATAVVSTIEVGEGPTNAVYDPQNGYVYVTSQDSGVEDVLSGTSVVDALTLGLTLPFDTVCDAANGLVYVLNETWQAPKNGWSVGTAWASEIRGVTLLHTVEIGGGPGFATFDSSNGWLYVPDGATDGVTVLNGTTWVGYVPVGGLPEDSNYDPADGLVYILDELSGQVSVLNGTQLVADISVGTNPSESTYNSFNGDMYIGNLGASSVSVLGTVVGWAVRFTETGLPTGTSWSVTDQGITHSSTSPTVVFYEPNGTYSYTINPVSGYNITSASTGVSQVAGPGGPISVVFSATVPPPAPPAPFPIVPVLYGSVVVGAAALVAVVLWTVRGRKKERLGRM
jgi:YVTN family beta-propeller protein